MHEQLLIVEDETTLSESLKRVLEREGYAVETVSDAESAVTVLDEGSFDLIITDIILPGMTGIELLRKVKESLPEQLVIVMTAYASLETAVEALRSGAYDYVIKPVMHEEIKQIVKNALKQGALQEENAILRRQVEGLHDLPGIAGAIPWIRRIVGESTAIAPGECNVLLVGETGTEKELVARMIHAESPRSPRPFIPVRCGVLSGDSWMAMLCGHVRGGMSGAKAFRRGLFEEGSGGTVFLDGILDLTSEAQAVLLKALEDHEIRPVGGRQNVRVDVRIISGATDVSRRTLGSGAFSEELFRRINGFTITIPPLRERPDDIEPLARYFLRRHAADLGKPVTDLDGQVVEALLRYPWPGNARELESVMERAVLLSDRDVVSVRHLPSLSS